MGRKRDAARGAPRTGLGGCPDTSQLRDLRTFSTSLSLILPICTPRTKTGRGKCVTAGKARAKVPDAERVLRKCQRSAVLTSPRGVIAQETGTRVYADLFLGIQSPADQESEFGA